jgi:ferric-dicitrate binding protein FerR (iron transport regulator)
LKIGKNNFYRWRVLLQVLNKELPEDDPAFQRWLREDVENMKLYQVLKGDIKEGNITFDRDKVFSNLSEILGFKIHKKAPLYKKMWFPYIASFLVLLSAGLSGYWVLKNINSSGQLSEVGTLLNSTDQRAKKAFLLSSQKEAIDLSEAFEIKKKDGMVISNTSEGVIRFEQSKSDKKRIEYHTLDILKGGEYELLLSDSSKVYLNSETQLIFPNYFEEDIRQVELIGEAYFEVKKSSKPFVVKTKDMQIRVLGTSFNVNAYQGVESVSTTLVEGSIEVNIATNSETFLLKPEYNFSVNKSSNEISIEKVNTDMYTAWIKGELVFRNQPLIDIFSALARWYDFTVVFEDPAIKTMRFTGSAMKERSLDYLLNQIQSVTDIKYRNEGSKIILY